MKAYAKVSHRFNSGNNLSATSFRPAETTYEGFITLMKDSLIPLMSNIKSMSISNKPTCASILNDFVNYSASDYADVVVAFYEGAIYECLRTADAPHFYNQPTSRPTPFGASGYFKNAATSLSA